MSEALFHLADDRGVLRISGPDARSFLQGLVSNDVTRATAERAIYAALRDRTIGGAGHNDIYARSNFHEAMREALAAVSR